MVARGDALGYGTALEAGRSLVRLPMVSLGFFSDINHCGVDSTSNRNE
jgi:hypothetical protein